MAPAWSELIVAGVGIETVDMKTGAAAESVAKSMLTVEGDACFVFEGLEGIDSVIFFGLMWRSCLTVLDDLTSL